MKEGCARRAVRGDWRACHSPVKGISRHQHQHLGKDPKEQTHARSKERGGEEREREREREIRRSPLRLLPQRYSFVRLLRLPNSAGIGPEDERWKRRRWCTSTMSRFVSSSAVAVRARTCLERTELQIISRHTRRPATRAAIGCDDNGGDVFFATRHEPD